MRSTSGTRHGSDGKRKSDLLQKKAALTGGDGVRCGYRSATKFFLSALYTPYEGSNLANQVGRKLRVFDRKLEGKPLHISFLSFINIRENKPIM